MDFYLPVTDTNDLVTWANQLTPPTNYHAGRVFQRMGLPDNILLFSRTSGKYLTQKTHPNRHHHHRHILVIALRGTGTLVLNEHHVRLPDRHAVLIHPLQFHHYLDFQEEEICWLFITFEGGAYKELGRWKNQSVHLDEKSLWIIRLLANLWGDSGSAKPALNEMPYALGWLLLHFTTIAQQSPPPAQEQTGQLLEEVTSWLNKHPTTEWHVTTLASGLGISDRHLRRCFQRDTGIGILRYLHEQKITRALHVLRSGGRISEAANAAGYDSIFTFSRAFRRMFGIPPSQYKTHPKKNPQKQK